MLGDKSQVECPIQCGGPNARLSALNIEQRGLRVRVGCDERCKKAQYSILCPSCNGTRVGPYGEECSEEDCQNSEGKHFGMKFMFRCPGSFQDANISQALKSWQHLRDYHTWPSEGGALDQASAFLDFLSVADDAVARATPKD